MGCSFGGKVESGFECGGIVGFVDQYVCESVGGSCEQTHDGLQHGTHGFSAAGKGGYEFAAWVFGDFADFIEQEFCHGLIVLNGADVVQGGHEAGVGTGC